MYTYMYTHYTTLQYIQHLLIFGIPQLQEELEEFSNEPGHAGGSHNIQQQLKEGLITRNPRLVETLAYTIFLAVFVWLCISTQGGAPAFNLTSNMRNNLGGFLQVADEGAWFDFMENTFPYVVVPTEYYNGEALESEHLGNVAGDCHHARVSTCTTLSFVA